MEITERNSPTSEFLMSELVKKREFLSTLPKDLDLNQPFKKLRKDELFITLKEISELLGVTQATVRRDLKKTNLWDYHFKRKGPNTTLEDIKKGGGKVCIPSRVVRELFHRRGFKYVSRVLTAQILKGGAGKTVISLALSRRYAQRGFKVLHIDLDHQANSTKSILDEASNSWNQCRDLNGKFSDSDIPKILEILDPRKTPKFSLYDYFKDKCRLEDCIIPLTDHLHLMASNISNASLSALFSQGKSDANDPIEDLKKLVKKLSKHYEIIIFDCPPDVNLQVIATALVSDLVLIPVIADTYCFDGLEMSYNAIEDLASQQKPKINVKKKIVFNRYEDSSSICPRKLGELHNHPQFSGILCQNLIREHSEIPNSLDQGHDFFDISGISEKGVPDYIREIDGVAMEILHDSSDIVVQ